MLINNEKKKEIKVKNNMLSKGGWSLSSLDEMLLLKRIEEEGESILRQREIRRGIITPNNKIFHINEKKRKLLIKEDPKCEELFNPIIKGRDIKGRDFKWNNLYLITLKSSANNKWPWSEAENDDEAEKIFKEIYPSIYGHIFPHKSILLKSTNTGRFYFELRNCNFYELFKAPKVIFAEISNKLDAVYDTEGFLIDTTLCCFNAYHYSILGILNSSVVNWYRYKKFAYLRKTNISGSFRNSPDKIKNLPLPKLSKEEDFHIYCYSKEIIDKAEDPEKLQRKINKIIYDNYQFTTKDIKIIESIY